MPQKTAKSGFTAEERAAMREHVQELKAAARRGSAAEDAAAVLAKIAEFPEADRALAQRVHEVIMAAAPELAPRLWYGMQAYAKDGRIVIHYQHAGKFKMRYGTLGFTDQAKLDDGAVWPVAYAVSRLTADDERRITALVQQAVG